MKQLAVHKWSGFLVKKDKKLGSEASVTSQPTIGRAEDAGDALDGVPEKS